MKKSCLELAHTEIHFENVQELFEYYKDMIDFELFWCKDYLRLSSKGTFTKNMRQNE
ncbi:hypothetical protein GOM49_02010 [Clostridium bovifaecis]|uniref:Uncharacterized protein n=1 Tax=Clostridium bovifaecis TaxID=2184719 RepID=A0A6I6ENQ1_9CLOT|nr:hypothetical protein GOM49_02010 [Clostridium bovifaecis]